MINDSSNIKVDSGRGDIHSSSKTGPTRKPKKDFKEVYAKEKREGRERDKKQDVSREDKDVKVKDNFDEAAENVQSEKRTSKTKGVSLFDLVGAKNEVDDVKAAPEDDIDIRHVALSKELKEESLSALFKGYGSKEKLLAIQEEVSQAPPAETKVYPNKELRPIEKKEPGLVEEKGEKYSEVKLANSRLEGETQTSTRKEKPESTRFVQEQPDLAGIHPLAAQQVGTPTTTRVQSAQTAKLQTAQIQEIIDQIVNKLYTIEKSDKTDTLIKLKHPPLFSGSNIVISSYKSAKGEFNITFENLTQVAKQMLDMKENQDALKFALDQKGYTVHIITATTLSETATIAKGEPASDEGKRERDESGSHSGKEKEREKK